MASRGVNSPGIQQLLEAENRANELVKAARNRKQQRMKAARDEAEKEVNQYRDQREQQFQAAQSKNSSGRDDQTMQIEADTKKKLETMQTNVNKHRDEVIKTLLDIVVKVEPKLHPNFKV